MTGWGWDGAIAPRPAVSGRGVGARVDLYWIPLGAGGHFVRFNGIVYEGIAASFQHRPRRELYHSALQVEVDDAVYAVEMTPVPNRRGWERGVVAEGPVGADFAGRFRVFRYEVRRWRDGIVPDHAFAVDSPIRLSDDPDVARRVLAANPRPCRSAVWHHSQSAVNAWKKVGNVPSAPNATSTSATINARRVSIGLSR
jgi:hypothetical protein